MKRALILN